MTKLVTYLRSNFSEIWKRRMAVLGLGLLLAVPVSLTTLNFLVPKSLSNGRSVPARAGWYLHSHQWQADMQTLLCAMDFLMNADTEIQTQTDSPSRLLSAPSRPAGPNFPSLLEVRVAGL